MYQLNEQAGFTLIELLFVLMIVSLLSFLAVPAVYRAYQEQQIEQFFQLMESDVLFAQNRALEATGQVKVLFNEDHYRIMIEMKEMDKREYPEHLTFRAVSTTNVRYNRNGTIQNPLTLSFYDQQDKRIKVVFPFGKGRFYVD